MDHIFAVHPVDIHFVVISVLYTFYCVVTTDNIKQFILLFSSLENKEIQYIYYSLDANNQTNNNIREKSSFPITNNMSHASACNTFGSLAHNANFVSQVFPLINTQIQFIINTIPFKYTVMVSSRTSRRLF